MSQARTLHIRLFGEFSLTYGDEPVTGVKSDRPQSLLAFLLLHRSAPQSRQRIAFTLWPDTSEANARGSLRNLLFLLRQGLPDVDTFIVGDSSSLQWSNDAAYTLDVADFEHALAQVRSVTDQAEQRYWLERAVDQYSGDLLPGNYDDWVIPIREELRQNYLDALYRLSGLLEEEGDYRAAIRYLQRQLQVDPLDEAAYVRLMRAHALSGDRAGVRRVYQTCVNALRRELDVDPSPSTQAAYEQLLRFEPPAAALPEAPARAALPALPEPLAPHIDERLWRPRPPTRASGPFIGREPELAQIAERLSDPDCRLLTLVGPGGVGKTRLALQVAAGHRAVFQDGVAYASLAALANADELAPAIAEALGVALISGADMHDLLFRLLRSKQLLLVLDNFEHLVEEVDLLVNLLRTAPQVKLLVTSRQRLDLVEEWVYELQGFAVPESVTTPKNSAVDLFLQSARRVRQNFEPDDEDIRSIVSICQMVGGLPLGIELAASWMRMLSPADIVREMERTLDFLTLNRRNLPERHRSLRAVFDHSWRLLSTAEQQLLSRLAVFRGDFSREAAEQVAGATLPMLLSLVDKSLVRLREGGRYGLHQLVHQYAREKLMEQFYGGAGRPEGGVEATHRRYAEHFLSLAEAALAAMRGADPVGSMEQLRAEHDNLRGALSWTIDRRHIELGLRFCVALWRFWWRQGYVAEGRRYLDQLLTLSSQVQDTELLRLRSQALHGAGVLARVHGDLARAQAMHEQNLALRRSLQDGPGTVASLNSLGVVAMFTGDYDRAEACFSEGLVLAQTQGHEREIYTVKLNQGVVAMYQGDYAARALHEEVLEYHRRNGEMNSVAASLGNLGDVLRYQREYAHAHALLVESLELMRRQNDRAGASITLTSLGRVALCQGDADRALIYLAESLRLQRETGDQSNMGDLLEATAHAAAMKRQWSHCARLCGAAAAVRTSTGVRASPADSEEHARCLEGVAQHLSAERVAILMAEGRELSIEQLGAELADLRRETPVDF